MKRYLLPALLLVGCQTTSSTPNPNPDVTLETRTENIRQKFNVPSLSLLMASDQKVLSQTVTGVRKYGAPEKVTLQDVHHLGSISKSFTATLIASLVEQKKLSFQSTLKDLFPEETMLPALENVTVHQLLIHRSGLVPNLEMQEDWLDASIPLAQRKASFLKATLLHGLKAKTSAQSINVVPPFEYSNVGYALLAMIAEQVGKKSYESLLEQHIFKPLQMKTCSVGFVWDTKTISQPWPHTEQNGQPVPISPEYPSKANGHVIAGNPEVINGADNVRCSLPDLSRYLQAHMNGENGKNGILKSETFKLLHTRHVQNIGPNVNVGYGYGWMVTNDAKGNLVFLHDGSNTLNYASAIVLPAAQSIFIAATNMGDPEATGAGPSAVAAGMEEMIQEASKTGAAMQVTPEQLHPLGLQGF